MAIYGLLIGINQYKSPSIHPLKGCVNDVYLFSQTLQTRFQIPLDHLKILINIEATHQNIIDHFYRYLIDRDWQQQDVAVIYISSHGSQSRADEIFWDIEPDHLNESIVCHDSRTQGVPDLLDKELRYLIAKLAKKCEHIAVFIDACHSAHITRYPNESDESVRLSPIDMNQYSPDSFVYAKEVMTNPKQITIKDVLAQSGKHLVLTGCQAFQVSVEKPQGVAFQQYGLFTYALCEILSSLQYPISYQELRNRIHLKVQFVNFNQSPQIEAIAGADVKQMVFGGELLPLHLLAYPVKDILKLNAGAIQGIAVGDEVALFDNEKNTSDLNTSIAIATVQQVHSFDSVLNTDETIKLNKKMYTAIITRQEFPKVSVKLCLTQNQDIQLARNILQVDISSADPGRFLQESDTTARYAVHERQGLYYLTQVNDSRALFKHEAMLSRVLEQAAVMARWQQKLQLQNPASQLGNPIDVIITYNGKEYINTDVELNYEFDGQKWQRPTFNAELRLRENQPDLYFALLYFDSSTGEICWIGNKNNDQGWLTHTSIAKEGAIKAQPSVKINEGKPIGLIIKNELLEQGVSQIQDSIKLIVCENEFDSSLLNQAALELDNSTKGIARGVSLKNTLNRLLHDVHRSLDTEPSPPDKSPDWVSTVINLTLIRPQPIVSISNQYAVQLLPNARYEVLIEAHASFQGSVRLTSLQKEQSRTIESLRIPESATLNLTSNVFTFSDGCNGDAGLDILEIIVNDPLILDKSLSGSIISSDAPLKISTTLPLENNVIILPYTFDEQAQFFIPLGYSKIDTNGRTTIFIEQLPETALTPVVENSKSLFSALRVYFRKLIYYDLLHIDINVHELRVFDIVQKRYLPIAEKLTEITSAQRILLLIHGIIGHTDAMVDCLTYNIDNTTIADQYDIILTFDYENLQTRIQDIARALKTQLLLAGIDNTTHNQRLDIVAHSMGGLVSRWFIEREGGDTIVNQLVMLGTPNGGSPYADVKTHGFAIFKTWVYSNLAIAINNLTTVPITGVLVAALLKCLDTIDNTLDQMSPDSDFIHELSYSNQPSSVTYSLIAGTTDGLTIQSTNSYHLRMFLNYLEQHLQLMAYNALTKYLFKESNDIAVTHSSMMHFNSEWQNNIQVESIVCDHLSYFKHKDSVFKIRSILTKNN